MHTEIDLRTYVDFPALAKAVFEQTSTSRTLVAGRNDYAILTDVCTTTFNIHLGAECLKLAVTTKKGDKEK